MISNIPHINKIFIKIVNITSPKSHLPASSGSLKRGIFNAYLYNRQINNSASKMLCEANHRSWEEFFTFVDATFSMTHNFVNNI
jgi:hypothetical protein